MYYIGIDLGGTNIAAGVVDENGKILAKSSVPTRSERPTDEIVKDMAALALSLKEKCGCEIKAVGIGCPGTIDFGKGEVVYSNNIPMEHYPLCERFREYSGMDVYADNDANCAAMGEYFASGANSKVFVMITLGTGVGGGVVLNGEMFRGFNGAAAEPGHITIISGGKKCTCGKEGCWEAYASATALIEQTKAKMAACPDSVLNNTALFPEINGKSAFDAAEKGDKAAAEVVEQYARYVAEGIVSLENIFQPEIIAVGGGVSHAGAALFDKVRAYVDGKGFNKFMPKTKIIAAVLGNDAGIIGAAMIAMQGAKAV